MNFLRDHPQPGPLYNTYDWGDFISWYLPEKPVAIDGRTDLYGDEIDNRFFMTDGVRKTLAASTRKQNKKVSVEILGNVH
jgi:hypothetical protein